MQKEILKGKSFTKQMKLKLGFIGFMLLLMDGTYKYLFHGSSFQTPFLLTYLTMPHTWNTYKKNMNFSSPHIENYIGPLALLKQTLPYAGFIQKKDEVDDIPGYFVIPEEEELITLEKENVYVPQLPTPIKQEIDLSKLKEPNYLLNKIYTGDHNYLTIDETLMSEWDFEALAKKEFRLDETIEGPKVLIFHTHAKERFVDETKSDPGILAMGAELERLLEEKYDIEALHVTDHFYQDDVSEDTNGCYERLEPIINNILQEYPSIQVCIDLHRDGIEGDGKVVGNLNGKSTSKIMFVNGLTRLKNQEGENIPMRTLINPYLEDNLAFSLQAQIVAMKYYPEITRKVYLKAYRYSLHMKPMSLLVEIGAQNDTSEEGLRAVEPIATILAKVLEKD